MDCKYYEELLSAYMDDEVTEAEKKDIEYHLAHCNTCKKSFELMLYLRNAIKNPEAKLEPVKKHRQRLYGRIFNYLLILFLLLVSCFSLTAITGGYAQLSMLSGKPQYMKTLFVSGIGITLAGLLILLYDNVVDLIKIAMKNK